MKQIKTIYSGDPQKFDEKVNEALAEGWTLDKRTMNQYAFIAEMEREVITEEEQTCENCKHRHLKPYEAPCDTCSLEENGVWAWEAEE